MTRLGWISFLILLLMDFVLRRLYHPISEVTLVSFCIALCFSVFFWSFVDLVICTLPQIFRKMTGSLIALFWVILLGSQATAFMRFGEYVTPFMANWVIRDPKYIFDYLWPLFNIAYLITFLLVWGFFYRLWVYGLRHEKILKRKYVLLKISLSFLLSIVSLNQLRRETLGQLRLADGALAFSLDTTLHQSKTDGYHLSQREVLVASVPPKKLPHIFLFIGESWSKGMVPVYGWEKSNTMPFLKKIYKDENFTNLTSAYTNSGATDVSIPSLFSGVGPEESSDKLHRSPLIWDWAKAAGYQTIFISPQRLAFNGIHQFFLSPGPDQFIPGDAISYKMVNDSGIDDLETVEFLKAKLDNLNKLNKPLFIIFFHNALHFPFLTESPGLTVPDFATRYEKALFITDQVIKKIVDLLKEQKMWDDTLFWITADHGEVESTEHRVPRISSFYEEILSIPYLIRWPTNVAYESMIQKCREGVEINKFSNVQNLDIVPTLVDLWEVFEGNESVGRSLKGQSLCHKIDPERLLIHLNTNKNRQWSPEGFAITKNKNRYAFTNIEGAKFFDLSVDQLSTRENEEKNVSPEKLKPFIKVIESEVLLRDLLRRYHQ